MKKNSIMINTSRGKIINENDLKYFLVKNKNFNVGLDVIDGEWLTNKKLLQHKLIRYSKNSDFSEEVIRNYPKKIGKFTSDPFIQRIDSNVI